MHRIEVYLKRHLPDARGLGLVRDIHDLGITTVSGVRIVDVYWIDAELTHEELELVCRSLLIDPLTQEYRCDLGYRAEDEISTGYHAVEVAYNAGVTDPVEGTIIKAMQDLGIGNVKAVRTAKRYLIEGRLGGHQLETIRSRLLVNPIVQHVVSQEPGSFPQNPQYRFKLEQVDILGMDEAQLTKIRQHFGFTDHEFQVIKAYFQREGHNPTDVGLETLAQTWSEHCVHKTFKGKIKLGGITIDNLIKNTIIKATEELAKPWCLSVFEV